MFDRLGRRELAATIAGFALSPRTALGTSEINTAITHLRDVLGEKTYEQFARKGETMTTAEMVKDAYDEIDQAQIELNTLVELRELRVRTESGGACSESPSSLPSGRRPRVRTSRRSSFFRAWSAVSMW